jgi:hypothetical protein
LLAPIEEKGYRWGDSLYYVREEGTCSGGMALIESMVHVDEMLDIYENKCVSIIAIKRKARLGVENNTNQCEEHIHIYEIGVHVVYSVDV